MKSKLLHGVLMAGGAFTAAVCAADPALAQTSFNFPLGGTITYTETPNPACSPVLTSSPCSLGSTGYDVSVTAANVNLNGAVVTQTDPNSPALVIDQVTNSGGVTYDGSLSVTFTGAPSAINSASTVLDVYHLADFQNGIDHQTGDVSLDTSGTSAGNIFAGSGFGNSVDVVADDGNATVVLGHDTISSGSGTALRVDVGNGNATVTTAATITSGGYGIKANARNLSVTVSGSVSGTQASVFLDGSGQNTLTLQTGAALTGDAHGSTRGGATNALVLQGQGTTNNNFVGFNTLNMQGSGIWALNGVSSIGTTTVASGNLKIGDITHQSAQLTSNITVNSGATLSGYGTIIGPVVVNGAEVLPGDGALAIKGNFTQTGGQIVFQIDSDGSGGFLESKLLFDPGKSLSINGADIIFDFLDGADPLAFYNSGQFNIDTFFGLSDGDPFSTDENLGLIFTNDSFDVTAPGETIESFTFTPQTGATALTETASAVPEPVTLSLFSAGLAGAVAIRRRKKKAA